MLYNVRVQRNHAQELLFMSHSGLGKNRSLQYPERSVLTFFLILFILGSSASLCPALKCL